MPIGEGILLSDLAICVGIVDNNRHHKLVHLVAMEQPQSVLTQPWKTPDKFEPGLWYRRKVGTKNSWLPLDDGLVPSVLIHVDDQRTLIELCLPVLFAPNLSALFSSLKFKDPLDAQRPICPLFGPESNQILPIPSICFRDKYGKPPLAGCLYYAPIHLSFAAGSPPNWSYCANYQGLLWSSPFDDQQQDALFNNAYRAEGIVAEKICLQDNPPNGGALHCCILLENDGKVAIYVSRKDRTVDVGKRRQFLPIKLSCYNEPLTLALEWNKKGGHAAGDEDGASKMNIKKMTADNDYEFKLEITPEILAQIERAKGGGMPHCLRLPFMPILIDPFSLIGNADGEFTLGQFISIRARVQWHLDREMAIWTAIGCNIVEENDKMDDSETNSSSDLADYQQLFQSSTDGKAQLEGGMMETNTTIELLAVHFGYKAKNGNAIFLSFDDRTMSFIGRHDISIPQDLNPQPVIANWYFVKFDQPIGAQFPTVRSLVKTVARCQTTMAMGGVCAQFAPKMGPKLIMKWHRSRVYCDSEQYHSGKLWPKLCANCFPLDYQCNTPTLSSTTPLPPERPFPRAPPPIEPIQKKGRHTRTMTQPTDSNAEIPGDRLSNDNSWANAEEQWSSASAPMDYQSYLVQKKEPSQRRRQYGEFHEADGHTNTTRNGPISLTKEGGKCNGNRPSRALLPTPIGKNDEEEEDEDEGEKIMTRKIRKALKSMETTTGNGGNGMEEEEEEGKGIIPSKIETLLKSMAKMGKDRRATTVGAACGAEQQDGGTTNDDISVASTESSATISLCPSEKSSPSCQIGDASVQICDQRWAPQQQNAISNGPTGDAPGGFGYARRHRNAQYIKVDNNNVAMGAYSDDAGHNNNIDNGGDGDGREDNGGGGQQAAPKHLTALATDKKFRSLAISDDNDQQNSAARPRNDAGGNLFKIQNVLANEDDVSEAMNAAATFDEHDDF